MKRAITPRLLAAVLAALMVVSLSGAASADAGFTPPPRPDDPAALRVMTYNVRYPSRQSGHEDWLQRAPDMAAQLAASDLDILGTQELVAVRDGYTQVADITAMLPGFTFIGRSRSANPNDEQMGVYYREDRLEALESGHFWLSPTPQRPGSFGYGNTGNARMVTWVLFRDERTAARFSLLNTHFDHASENARYRAADQLAGYMTGDPAYAADGVSFDPTVPVVMTGDFNFDRGRQDAWYPADAGQPTVDPIKGLRPLATTHGVAQAGASAPVVGNLSAYNRLVTAGPFVDSWETAAVTGPEVLGTFSGFGELQAGRWLDWILTSPSVKTLQSYVDTSRPGGQWPSDHVPVVADLVIEP